MPHNVKINRVLYILLHEDTTMVRFFLGICSLMMAAFIGLDKNFPYFHESMLRISTQSATAWMFGVYGSALIYGAITSKFNRLLLFIEGMLGVFIWSAYAWSDVHDHGNITPSLVGAVIAFLLLVRYPTHYTPPPMEMPDVAE